MCMVAESCPVAVSENLFQWGEGPLNGGGNHDPLKVTTEFICCLNQIRLYAGTSEDPTVPLSGENLVGADNQQGSQS